MLTKGGSCAILLLLDPHSSDVEMLLREHGHAIAHPDGPTQAIERCKREPMDAAVIDQCYFGEATGWAIAPSLKKICPQIAVILILHGPILEHVKLPTAVDCIVSDRNLQSLLQALGTVHPAFNEALGES